MKVDIVIATKGEQTLKICIESIHRSMEVNRIIIVSSDPISLGDLNIISKDGNVGEARAKGLDAVETQIYASIDSDVLVTP